MIARFALTGRVALVTGAGQGIGQALARGLAEAGCRVALGELPEQLPAARSTAAAIQAEGGESVALPLDVTVEDGVIAFVEAAEQELGPADILVNNAGINLKKPVLEIGAAAWDRVFAVNVRGTFLCAREVGRRWIAAGRPGVVINLASQLGVVGFPNRAAYAASKGAVVQLTRALAVEWAPHGIRVNAIAPAVTRTPMNAELAQDPAAEAEARRRMPIGRLADPEDLVGAAVYLASDAAAMVTGHVLMVDGGWTAI